MARVPASRVPRAVLLRHDRFRHADRSAWPGARADRAPVDRSVRARGTRRSARPTWRSGATTRPLRDCRARRGPGRSADQIPALGEMGQLVLAKPSKGTWRRWSTWRTSRPTTIPTTTDRTPTPTPCCVSKGRPIVSDAGANDLLRIKQNGSVEVIATFPNVDVPGPGGAPFSMDDVPTTVAKGPDGALYVGQLTGFPFPVAAPRSTGSDPAEPRSSPRGSPTSSASRSTVRATSTCSRSSTTACSPETRTALIRVAQRRPDDRDVRRPDHPGGLAVRGGTPTSPTAATCAGGGEVLRIPLGARRRLTSAHAGRRSPELVLHHDRPGDVAASANSGSTSAVSTSTATSTRRSRRAARRMRRGRPPRSGSRPTG